MKEVGNLMVSVDMITYKHEDYIGEAIEGVLMQETNFEFDLIIADDCSPDRTQEIVEHIIKVHPKGYRIKYFRNKENLGMQANGFFAAQQCTGKYVAICEGDDYWSDPLKLQKQVDFLEANPDYIFSVHRYKLYLENKKEFEHNTIHPLNYGLYKEKEGRIEIDEKSFSKDWLTQPLTAVIVREDLNKVLSKQFDFKYFRDYHIFYFLLQRGKGVCLNSCSGVYRINDGGVASRKTFFEKLKIAFLIYEELYLYTKDTSILLNYWKFAFALIRRVGGFKIISKSFFYNFNLNDKLISIKCFFVAFFDLVCMKMKKYANLSTCFLFF